MSDLHLLEAKLAESWPPLAWADVSVLLAVSGGLDSVALLRAMLRLKTGGPGRLVVAHFNHQLRGSEAAEDEAFVVGLCRGLHIPIEVGWAPAGQLEALAGDGLEAAARSARYRFLKETAARLGARYVVTAHTADDQAETILHRVLRGTGIAGLAGMPRSRTLGPAATLIRPLLGMRRAELTAYLTDLGQDYRFDSSNQDIRLTRNRLRHELLPQIARQFNPGVVEALLRLGRLAGEAQEVIEGLVEGLLSQAIVEERDNLVRLAVGPLANEPRYVVRELLIALWQRRGWPLQSMGFEQWDLLASMLLPCPGETPPAQKRMFPGSVLVEVREGEMRMERTLSPAG